MINTYVFLERPQDINKKIEIFIESLDRNKKNKPKEIELLYRKNSINAIHICISELQLTYNEFNAIVRLTLEYYDWAHQEVHKIDNRNDYQYDYQQLSLLRIFDIFINKYIDVSNYGL